MISFPAHSLIFHLIKLYFVEHREDDIENCSHVTVHKILIYIQGYSSQKFHSAIIEITRFKKLSDMTIS